MEKTYLIFPISFFILFVIMIINFFIWTIKYRKNSTIDLAKKAEKILLKLSRENREFSINEILGKPKEIDKNLNSLYLLKQKGFIERNGSFIKISNTGIEHILNINSKDSERISISQKILIDILIALIAIMLSFATFQMSVIQTTLLKNSNPPIQATLEFISNQEDLILSAGEVSDYENLKRDSSDAWGEIDITVLNFGQMDSNHVDCHNINYDKLFGYLKPSNFINIPAGSSNMTTLHIRYTECQLDSKEKCDKMLILLGVQNLTFKCECYGCKDQRNFKFSVPFCVYLNSIEECSNFTGTILNNVP